MLRRAWAAPLPVIVGVLLGAAASGCASNDPREKAAGGYLSSASAAHSEFDMRMSLLFSANGRDCGDNECDSTYHFEQRVQRIGEALSLATFAKYPELSKRFKQNSGRGAGVVGVTRGTTGEASDLRKL